MKIKRFILLLLIASALCAAGCGAAPQTEEYTLRFLADGVQIAELTAAENTCPEPPAVADSADFHFAGWDRELTPATENAEYTAVFLPMLTQHVPYLFCGADGLLHPDEPLTGQDAALALRALASDAVEARMTDLPAGEEPVTAGALRTLLAQFYFENDPAATELPDDHILTRSEAAAMLNPLLGRADEQVEAFGSGFADVPPSRGDYADLMEAAARHAPGDTPWEQVVLPTGLTPGRRLEAGRLRQIDAQGYITYAAVTDDGFQFDSDGWFTSGDTALDACVTEIIAALRLEDPEADAETLLRLSFNYVRDSFAYLRKASYAMGETGWETEDALEMFTSGRGNCYNYAAAFWALARGLGYDARAISGTISKDRQPHGWVEIDFDEETFYFDTETEMAYLRKKQYGFDMFKMPWSYAATWSYRKIN